MNSFVESTYISIPRGNPVHELKVAWYPIYDLIDGELWVGCDKEIVGSQKLPIQAVINAIGSGEEGEKAIIKWLKWAS